MNFQRSERLLARLRGLSTAASGLAVAVGATTLVGWSTGNLRLTSISPGLVPMNPLTAVLFVLLGTGLALSRSRSPQVVLAGRACAAVVAILGLVRLAAYLSGGEAGIDQILFQARLAAVPFGPNRMAPDTAFVFVLLGVAVLLADVKMRRGGVPGQYFAVAAAVVGLTVITGYAYSSGPLQRIGTYIPMALNTALLFLVLSLGILAARPEEGVMAVVTSAGAGGALARRFLFVTFAVPWALGWLHLEAQQGGLHQAAVGVAVFAMSTIVTLAVVSWRTARAVDRADAERQRAEHALRERTHDLEAANEALKSFTYSVSHDLRAPLRAIDGYARMLVEDHAARLDAEGERLLGVVRQNARQMSRLIDDLLSFSRLGRAELKKSTLDVGALVQAVVTDLRAAEPDRRVRVTIDPLLPAVADGTLLREVVSNLVGNAWKFTRGRAEATIHVGCTQAVGETVYFVRDNGAGFDMAYAAKLFGVFQRLHRAEQFEGTGVGLAIVQRIVQRHGGRVWAEGAVDRGATFYVALAAVDRPASAA